jgi:small-conductance mechanosensitive channel
LPPGPALASVILPVVRSAFRWLSATLFAAVVVQVALAAFGGFDAVHKAEHVSISKKMVEDSFTAHGILGSVIVLVMLVVLIVAAAGRLGPAQTKLAGVIFGLGVLQYILGIVSTSAPAIGLLHGLNALAIFSTTGILAHRTWAAHSRDPVAADVTPAVS